jgi:succinyl-diaminopimelate desuccinylase
MKAAIAAFAAAAAAFLADRGGDVQGSLSLLLTGDEEGDAINGTEPVLRRLAEAGERFDACLVGEPTCEAMLGDMIKIGRRGSLNGRLRVDGTQGHVAYPERADNPIPRLIAMLARLTAVPLDAGTPHFPPSALVITSVDVGNPVHNLIPQAAEARFNVRFNDRHTADSLRARLVASLDGADAGSYRLDTSCSGEAFVCPPGRLSEIVAAQVHRITGRTPVLSTTGGTSDARFIKDHCPVVEFGMVGETAHKVDENVAVDDILALTEIYRAILHAFFERRSACPA